MTAQAKIVYARPHQVICPHCEEPVEGWLNDPRGLETTCDTCDQPFSIALDAEVRLA